MREFIAASAILLVIITLLAIWCCRPVEKLPQLPQVSSVANSPTTATASTSSTAGFTNVKKQLPGGPYEPSDPRWAEVNFKDKIDKNWEWKKPISFYGKVIDQNGQPVSGASVQFSWTDLSPEGSSQSETTSDTEGNFALENKVGRVLMVTVKKPGYYIAKQQNQSAFDFAGFWQATYHEPDFRKAVIFHLREKGIMEDLVTGKTEAKVPSDGKATQIVLSRNRSDSWANLEVQAWTNTDKYPPRTFDWRLILSVPGGEIQPCSDEFPFSAPEGDYRPIYEVNMPTTAENWRHGTDLQFYIRYSNPVRYGRIRFQMDGASQRVFVTYWLNPTPESRNLEAEPKRGD